jgi:large subunit ribosomal protein L29
MSLPKIKEINLLNKEEITKEILASKKELFELRLKQATKQYFTPHSFRHLKHRIAQLLMVQKQQQTNNNLISKKEVN